MNRDEQAADSVEKAVTTLGDEHHVVLAADANGDGRSDVWVIDTTGDGKADLYQFDTTGDGTVDVTVAERSDEVGEDRIVVEGDGGHAVDPAPARIAAPVVPS